MKVAKFKNVEYDNIEIVSDESREKWENYVRTSEYIDVEFTDRKQSEVINEQVAALDKVAEELGNKYMEGLAEIKQRKEELLALTVQ